MKSNTPPNPRQLILKLLIANEGEPITTREMIAACRLMGVSENHVRVALVRLASTGQIEAAGSGTHRLGPEGAELAADVARWRSGEARVRAWEGDWIVAYSGALGRTDRTALRARNRALDLLGMRQLEKGLHIRPNNLAGGVDAVRDRLLGLGTEAPVFVAHGFDVARERCARRLWNGAALSRSYRDMQRRLESWLEHADTLEAEDAAREAYLLGDKAIRQLVFDPLLPEPLVDVAARSRFTDAVLRFDKAGHEIWRRIAMAAASPVTAQSAIRPRGLH